MARKTTKRKVSRSRGRGENGLSVAVAAGLVSYGAQILHSSQEGIYGMTRAAVLYMVGYDIYDKNFHFEFLNRGLLPVLGGLAIHGLANKFGLNRKLASWGIPYIRI